MSDPEINSIEYISPKTNRFKLKVPNTFSLVGQNLAGVTVTNLAGVITNGNKQIEWSNTQTLDNTSPTKLKVRSTPKKVGTDVVAIEDDDEDKLTSDPGSLTVTVTGNITQQVPADYGP